MFYDFVYSVAVHIPSYTKNIQSLTDHFDNVYTDFKFPVSLKKKQLLAETTASPKIAINNYELEVVVKFTYLDLKFVTSCLSTKS